MVVYGLEDFLGRNEQTGHLPDRHLKIHLGEFEKSGRVISSDLQREHAHLTF